MAKLAARARAGGGGHAGLGEEVQEGGVVLVDFAEGVLHLGEGLVEDGFEDAVLLVGEERGEGVGGGGIGVDEGFDRDDGRRDGLVGVEVEMRGCGFGGGVLLGRVDGRGGTGEEAVDEADDLGEVGAADGGADLGGEGGEGVDLCGVGGVVALDGGGEVLVAEVEDGEADGLGLFGDAGADEGAAEGDASAAGGEDLVGVAVEVEAEELAVLGVGAEDGADGVVGADGFEADASCR